VKDQPSTSGDNNEPERPKTIPDDFIWDPENECWYPPGEPSTFDVAAWLRQFEEARRRGDFGGGGLISVDELRAAGALDVPPAWRKSLCTGRTKRVERDLFSGLSGDDDPPPEKQQPTRTDPDDDGSADELR
jgi:hypothetical protein